MKIKLKIKTKTTLSDTVTPVGLYYKFRDQYPNSFLLESSTYNGNDNNYSYLCLDPLLTFVVKDEQIKISGLGINKNITIQNRQDVIHALKNLVEAIEVPEGEVSNGFYGYTAYDSIRYFETLDLSKKKPGMEIPDLYYALFRFVIRIDHFKNNMTILENITDGSKSKMTEITKMLSGNNHPGYHFELEGEESSNMTDSQFKKMVTKGKKYCKIGDVFQIVVSRGYRQAFTGDEFNLYRTLRSINPSPYLFYFDFGNFKLFGSSPEAQLKINHGKAIINPIAGTIARTGDPMHDKRLANHLAQDPKENAEHTMLVDLARNDLSRHGDHVRVKTYKDIQYFSHVIHLVSEVEAQIKQSSDSFHVYADTFPAGTLSGAPKYRAMQLIDELEPDKREYYGGAIGFIGLDGSINQAITIRSFLSKDHILHFRAGAGIVIDSQEEKELNEVSNKLKALKKAMHLAQKINRND